MKAIAADAPGSSPGDEPASRSFTVRKFGNGLLSLTDFVVTLVEFALFAFGLLFALVLGGLVVGALSGLLTGSAHQGLVVGVVLTGWTCLVIGVVALAARGRRRREGEADLHSHPDGSVVAHSKPEPDTPGLKALAREGALLIVRAVGLAAICALAPAIVAGALTGNVLTAVAVGIVAFPVVLVQGLVAIKVDN
ncbi:MAG TPA: hypothetical protein VFJ64_04975 [Solirubrobacterales bacterium]|nr:hypothetical protein [Solirubrobacterales bacterium]